MASQRIPKISLVLLLLFASFRRYDASANPYLAKSGESPVAVRVATCAISGGFIHLYNALDYGLFDKYDPLDVDAMVRAHVEILFAGRAG